MASWEKNSSSIWPTWEDNKVFTVLLAIFLVYGTVWLGVQIKKSMRETVRVGFSDNAAPTITVTATGKASVVPDIATTDISVTKTADTAAEAQSAASKTMTTVLTAIKALGVAEADLQTSSFNTSEVYDYDQSPAVVTGYQSSQTLTIKIRKTDNIAAVLDAGPKNGATSVSSIRYSVDDDAVVLASARGEAIAKAEAQAKAIASSLHERLGAVVNYSESSGGNYPMMYGIMADSAKSVESIAPSIEVGEQETQMTVYITYSLK